MKVTVDTNAFPIGDLSTVLGPRGFEFIPITVTTRELKNTSLQHSAAGLGSAPEIAVWDESRWDESLWGDRPDRELLEKALAIIGNGSFPKPGQRAALSPAQKRQLRDAMIASSHKRHGHDVLLTGDLKGFVRGGRRERFRDEMGITVMTPEEFRQHFIAPEAG